MISVFENGYTVMRNMEEGVLSLSRIWIFGHSISCLMIELASSMQGIITPIKRRLQMISSHIILLSKLRSTWSIEMKPASWPAPLQSVEKFSTALGASYAVIRNQRENSSKRSLSIIFLKKEEKVVTWENGKSLDSDLFKEFKFNPPGMDRIRFRWSCRS